MSRSFFVAEHDDPKSRFWAERAGAVALVSKGRMGELTRVLKRVVATAPTDTGFFTPAQRRPARRS